MTETGKISFRKVSNNLMNDFGDMAKNDLIVLGKEMGASEEELQKEFPRLFQSEDSSDLEVNTDELESDLYSNQEDNNEEDNSDED